MEVEGEVVDASTNGNGYSGTERLLGGGHNLQRVQTSYATAMTVQKPRSLEAVRRSFLAEAALAGSAFYYGWGAGKDRIEGPSIGLAMSLARLWGNCALDLQPVQETADAWIFTAVFIDLETGFTLPRQFRQAKKWTVYGKLDADRKDDMRFQIGQSKAARNVIKNALPSWLIDEAIEKAKEGLKDKIDKWIKAKGIVFCVESMVKALAKHGVKEPDILALCAVAKREAITLDHVVILRENLSTLERGEEFAEVLFPSMKASAKEEATQGVKDLLHGGKPVDATEKAAKQETTAKDNPADLGPDASADEAEKSRATQASVWQHIDAAKSDFELQGIGKVMTEHRDLWGEEVYDGIVAHYQAAKRRLEGGKGKRKTSAVDMEQ